MNIPNCVSFSDRDNPPEPKELLTWLRNRDLFRADSAVKKHFL